MKDNLFDFEEKRKLTKPIRLIELFGGVGAQAMALNEIGANFEHYRLVEFDRFPVASYNAIHGTNFAPQDIRDVKGADLGIIETDEFDYIMTYSFPCQDLSVEGKQKGMSKDSGTRSGLLWEVERLLNETENLPQVLLMENVPQVHGKKNRGDFDKWCEFLRGKGYVNYWQDLNAKDYEIPQSRNRTFMISFLGGGFFNFPPKKTLKKSIADFLEEEVEEKFFIEKPKAKELILTLKERNLLDLEEEKSNEIQILGKMDHRKDNTHESANRVYKTSGICPAINTCGGGGLQPKICEKTIIIDDTQGFENEPRIYKGTVPSIRAQRSGLKTICRMTGRNKDNLPLESKNSIKGIEYRIRKLTPRECWRLMGFLDSDFDKAAAVNSNTQLYKQAGNSIVKDVLVAIFRELIQQEENGNE
jgi:DNA (cytosine-5)-methyltransferase 1